MFWGFRGRPDTSATFAGCFGWVWRILNSSSSGNHTLHVLVGFALDMLPPPLSGLFQNRFYSLSPQFILIWFMGHEQVWTSVVSLNTSHPSWSSPSPPFIAFSGFGVFWPFYERFDLLSSLGESICVQGQVTAKWSFKQNVWRVLRWTGQSGGRQLRWRGDKIFLNVIDEVSHIEERRWEKQ